MVNTDVEGAGAAEVGGGANDVEGVEASLETLEDSTDGVGCWVTVTSGKDVIEVATMEGDELS